MAPDFTLDPRSTALLVVDMQNDFCKPRGFFAQAGHDVGPCLAAVESARLLLEVVRSVGVRVVYTKSVHGPPPPHRLVPLRFRAPRDSPNFVPGVGGTEDLPPGTWGTEIVEELTPHPGDLVIEKARYSPFFRTRLEDELRRRAIGTVVIVGTYSHVCVEAAARDAYMRDFDVLVVSDCVAALGGDRDLHEASLRNTALLFGVVAPASDVVAALEQTVAASGAR